MKQEDYEWLTANLIILQNVRMTPEQNTRLFAIYNAITGENKPATSCGRCVMNVKKRIKFEYEKQRDNN